MKAFRRLSAAEIHRLGPLNPSELSALEGNQVLESRSERTRVGLVRTLPAAVGLSLPGARSWGNTSTGGRFEPAADGRLTWTSGFASEGAGAIRLLLEDVIAPWGTVAFVYSASGETHGPYSLGGDVPHDVWTNAVFSDEVFLEIQIPEADGDPTGVNLSVSTVAHMEHEWFAPSKRETKQEALADCFRDASCVEPDEFPELGEASKAIAHISYREGNGVFACSGGLLNTTAGASIPYFLTASHCIDDAQSAASIEAYWDYRTPACGSAVSRSDLARTLGATLLATGSKQKSRADFTLLRFNQEPPPGRYYLGWSADKQAVAAGATLHRIAHPDGAPQSHSVHRVSSVPTPGSCDDLPTTRFIYSKVIEGATKGGSSGAPLFVRDGLKVVGQLFGRCGRNLDDACDATENSAVDGSFATYFDDVRQWLDPPRKERCNPTAVALCLTGGKFRVEVVARDLRSGRGTTGTAIPQNDVFGYFSLPELTGQSENPEIFVKIVDGSALNGKYWVFYGGLTDLEFVIEVTDVETGTSRIYAKDAGGYCGNSDTAAF